LVGVSAWTMRKWEREGRIRAVRVGERGDRRFRRGDVLALMDGQDREVRWAAYCRVSGSAGQDTSIVSQEQAIRDAAPGDLACVFSDRASGLNDGRRGLRRALDAAREGQFDVVAVTHQDRLTRFGFDVLVELFDAYGVRVVVLNQPDETTPEEELLADFMSLIAVFSGRLYGQRSAAARRRLLTTMTQRSG
jgi:putative resolvase